MTIQEVENFCRDNPIFSTKFIFDKFLGVDYDRIQQLEDLQRKINRIKDGNGNDN